MKRRGHCAGSCAADKFRQLLPSDMINLLNPINKQRGAGQNLSVAMRECESCVRAHSQRGKVPSFNCESLAVEQKLGSWVESLASGGNLEAENMARKLPQRHIHTDTHTRTHSRCGKLLPALGHRSPHATSHELKSFSP